MHGYSIDATGTQWGVGQGGFFTQTVSFSEHGDERLVMRFVYDCGTKSSFRELTNAIKSYVAGLPDGSTVEAIYISHLDEDHVNGLSFLAAELNKRNVTVERVVIPPVSDLEALKLVTSGAGTQEWEDFVIDPTKRLRDWFSEDQRTIYANEPNRPIDYDPATLPDYPEDADTFVRSIETGNGGVQVVVGGGSSAGRLPEITLWEVVPFVQPAVVRDEKRLNELVEEALKSDIPLSWHFATDLVLISAEQRKLVREIFDHWDAGDVNYASIILYSGSARQADMYDLESVPSAGTADAAVQKLVCATTRTAWLGTGDAKFSDSRKDLKGLDAFKLFYGGRLNRLLIVNAPHHGSAASSGDEFWRVTEPNFAVFNASGKHHGHPNAAVVALTEKYASTHLQTHDNGAAFTFHLTTR
jgi:hypothetical protein